MGKQVGANTHGGVAQLGEHLPCKQGVMSSNLTISICTLKTAYELIRKIIYMISQYKTSEDVILKGNEQRETQEFLLKEFLTKLREPKP